MDEYLKGRGQSMDGIAVNVYHGKYSSCLKAFADSWLKADSEMKEILRPAWLAIIECYNLVEEVYG